MPYTTLISAPDLARLLDQPSDRLTLIDCRFSLADTERGRRDYLAAHIPGAIYAHLDDDLSGPIVPGITGRHPLPQPDVLAQTCAHWGIGPGTQVVCYDDFNGGIAARLWWLLCWLGHDAAAVLDGGWPAWVAFDGGTRNGRETRIPAGFSPRLRPELAKTTADVEGMRLDPVKRLIDSRAPERYRGENETIDSVAGHIPSAANAFWQDNLDADGKFLPPAALAARFAEVLGDTPPEEAVFYCGSGVTACHNLLALQHAGLGEAKLYAGSWSEWITDAERAVAHKV